MVVSTEPRCVMQGSGKTTYKHKSILRQYHSMLQIVFRRALAHANKQLPAEGLKSNYFYL